MPNIAITNFCNLKCPYCFANTMIEEDKQFISMDNFKSILNFLGSDFDRIGIIGGEPTLHPHFSEILNLTNNFNTDLILFTNGIELYKYLNDIGNYHVLINYNNPDGLSETQKKNLQKTLEEIQTLGWFADSKVICGCNLHLNCLDYSWMWDLVDTYSLPIVRCSVVCPEKEYVSVQSNKMDYYEKMKPIFIQFCKDAFLHKCKIIIDCNHIPPCILSIEDMKIIERVCESSIGDFCDPVIDITMDGKATSCFGVYNPVDIYQFNNVTELDRFLFVTQNLPKAAVNVGDGYCVDCPKFQRLQCQGGCLAFSPG